MVRGMDRRALLGLLSGAAGLALGAAAVAVGSAFLGAIAASCALLAGAMCLVVAGRLQDHAKDTASLRREILQLEDALLAEEAGLGVPDGARGDRICRLVQDGSGLEGLTLGQEGVLELEDLAVEALFVPVVVPQAGGDDEAHGARRQRTGGGHYAQQGRPECDRGGSQSQPGRAAKQPKQCSSVHPLDHRPSSARNQAENRLVSRPGAPRRGRRSPPSCG